MRKNRRNYYRILQVQPDASQGAIKNNYRTLLQKMRLHPDLGGEDWNASLINKAYSTLRNPTKRVAYDRELLNQYHVSTLSQGHFYRSRASAKTHEKLFSIDKQGNKRNYYRILHIQPDSSAAIIKTIYETLIKRKNAPVELLNEAYQVLGNPSKRKNYDRLLHQFSHSNTLNPHGKKIGRSLKSNNSKESKDSIKQKPQGSSITNFTNPKQRSSGQKRSKRFVGYKPLIRQYCVFCKTPQVHSPCEYSPSLCKYCQSPLSPPPVNLSMQPRRSLDRIEQSGLIRYYSSWPGKQYSAALSDLSPTGMCMIMSQNLEHGQIIKIDAEDFMAVGEITFIQSKSTQSTVGIHFLTVQFNNQKGCFISEPA
jgi:curved DNA-binding protein CbpA